MLLSLACAAARGQCGRRPARDCMRLALITDTHLPALIRQLDELWPECGAFFGGADLILHGGDVTSPAILDWLEQFAPVIVAKGNNDGFTDPRMQPVQYLEVDGWRIG